MQKTATLSFRADAIIPSSHFCLWLDSSDIDGQFKYDSQRWQAKWMHHHSIQILGHLQ